MRVWATAYWVPKQLSSEREYEDAFGWWPRIAAPGGPASAPGTEVTTFRAAIADGATSTSYSGLWARLLVRAALRDRLSSVKLAEDLEAPQRTWRRLVGRKPLPWYAEQKIENGAFAAFVSFELRAPLADGGTASWSALALGDACLIRLRGEHILSFPLEASAAFSFNPLLLSTRPDRNGEAISAVQSSSGEARPLDTFFLMTDALAQWFLKSCEENARPWDELMRFVFPDEPGGSTPAFREWVDDLRAHGRIKDDDVTLVAVGVEQ